MRIGSISFSQIIQPLTSPQDEPSYLLSCLQSSNCSSCTLTNRHKGISSIRIQNSVLYLMIILYMTFTTTIIQMRFTPLYELRPCSFPWKIKKGRGIYTVFRFQSIHRRTYSNFTFCFWETNRAGMTPRDTR